MMRKKLVAFLAVIAMLSLCVAIGSFSALAEEPSAQAETKVYNIHAIENLHYQKKLMNAPGEVTPTASGIKFTSTYSTGDSAVGGTSVGLFTEVVDNFEVTVAPGTMYDLGGGNYTRFEYMFAARVGGNSYHAFDMGQQMYMVYIRMFPINGDYANGVNPLIIAHDNTHAVWGQAQVAFPAGANGEVKIEIAKNASNVYQLVINGKVFDDSSFGNATINNIVNTIIGGTEKPFISVGHHWLDAAVTTGATVTSYVKTVNGAALRDFTDVVGGAVTKTVVYDTGDWTNYSSGSVNYSRSSITSNGVKISGDFAAGNGTNGYPTYVYNKALGNNLDEYSVTVTDLVTVNETRASIWWANAPVASWTSNPTVLMMRVFTDAVHVFINTGDTGNIVWDVAGQVVVPYKPINGAVTIALRKTADGYAVVVNGTVANISATGIAKTLANMAAKGGIYFGTGHDYDGVTVAGKYSHVIAELNGTKFVPASVEVAEGEAIEYSAADWSTALAMGSNERTFAYDGGLKLGTTLKKGVALADAAGVAGGWTTIAYTKAFANNLDEYSVKVSIDNPFYENAATYGKTIVYFVDKLDNTYPYGNFIAFSIESDFGTLATGGNVRVTSNAVTGGDSHYVGFIGDGNDVTIVIRKAGDDYNMYVNGTLVRFMGSETVKNAFAKMENVYVGVQTEYAGAPSEDAPFSVTVKEVNGSAIVNKYPDVILVKEKPIASNVTKTSATVTWTAFSNDVLVNFDSGFNFAEYVVERYKGNDKEAEETFTVEEITYTDTDLTPNTTYHYFVKAVDANNNVLATYATVKVTTLDYTNFTAINAAVSAAEALVAGVTVSVDGAELANGVQYYVQADVDTYNAAITAAKAVAENADALQGEVDAAVATLNTATATFEAAVKTAVVNFADLNAAVSAAEALVAGVTVSEDGTGLAKGTKYCTQAVVDAYNAAITAAKAVANNANAIQGDVDAAVEALNTATATFEAAVKTVEVETLSCGGNVSAVSGIVMAVAFAAMAVLFIGKKKENC